MAIRLYDHQIDAIERLHSGAVLVGGVGSGKSLAALGYFFSKELKGKSIVAGDKGYAKPRIEKKLFIITTARKRDSCDWIKEAGEFNIIPIVDSWNNINNYASIKDAFFIFDEQRLIGNGAWVKSFYKIAKNNRWILLSATPGDTWMDYIPVMIANGFYPNRTEFLRRHVIFHRFLKYPKVERYIEVSRLIKIRDAMVVIMHYTKKTRRVPIDVLCSFDKDKTKRLMVDRWNFYENVPVRDIGELCFLLRKVANTDPSRLVELKKIFEEHKKLIVFYNFDYELELLRDFCLKNKIPFSEWNGHKHEEILKEELSWIYLCQYIAASEAWNAIETDTTVFYSQNYSYRIKEQASGRIDRMNTLFEVLYYYVLTSHSPIDLAIRKTLLKKQNFNESRFQSY